MSNTTSLLPISRQYNILFVFIILIIIYHYYIKNKISISTSTSSLFLVSSASVESSPSIPTVLTISFSQLHNWHKYRSNIPHPLRSTSSSSSSLLSNSISLLHCTGSLNDYSGYVYRSCLLSNICYNTENHQWSYYIGKTQHKSDTTTNQESTSSSTTVSSLTSDIFSVPVRFDSDYGMVSALSYRDIGLVSETMEIQDHRYPTREAWKPEIKQEFYPSNSKDLLSSSSSLLSFDTVEISQYIQLWYPNQHLFYDCNIGHLLWDWSTSMLYNMLILGYGNKQIWKSMGDKDYRHRIEWNRSNEKHSQVSSHHHLRSFLSSSTSLPSVDDIEILLTEEFPRFAHVPDALGLEHPLCRKTLPVIQPSKSLNTLSHTINVISRSITDGKPIKNLCFRNVAIGGYHYHIQPFPLAQSYSITNYGQDNHFLAYRNSILLEHGIIPSISLPKPHHRIVLLKKSSSFNNEQIPRRSIHNIDEVYNWLQLAYPSIDSEKSIMIIEPHKLSWQQQLTIFSSTTILITPCGGISTILPFLPLGASVIIMDYPEPLYNRSVSMENILWNHFSYLHIFYYQMYTNKDYIVTNSEIMENGQPNYRHNTLPVLHKKRILSLVSTAIRLMG